MAGLWYCGPPSIVSAAQHCSCRPQGVQLPHSQQVEAQLWYRTRWVMTDVGSFLRPVCVATACLGLQGSDRALSHLQLG